MKLRRVTLSLCGAALLSLALNAFLVVQILQAHDSAIALHGPQQLHDAQAHIDFLADAMLACLLGSLVLVLAAAYIMQRQLQRPIRLLSQAAAALAAGNYATRVGTLGSLGPAFRVQELAAMALAFNSMAAAIEHDLDQREAVQRALEQARQHADDASRAKSMFLANMSHEIRTPMNAIIGMSYLALQSGLPTRQHGYVAQVHESATALLALLNDILDFSKVEAGKMELAPAPFGIEQLLADALALVLPRAQEKGLELVLDLADRELVAGGGTLLGDALRLGQVLTNLLSNAVKFTERGSVRLTVQAERGDADGVALRFSVRDTGIGMEPAQMGCLFQEFSQADGSTTRRFGGTGLGLAISHRLAGLMGGRLSADSTPGQGSRFTLVLRLPRAPACVPAPAVPQCVRGLRVLVVDDHAATRLALQNLLRALGVDGAIDVVAGQGAARARLAAAVQSGRPYRLLLLDWALPEQDSTAWLAAMAAEGIALPPVAALLAGDAGQAAPPDCPEVLAWLAKPVQPAGLRGLLARLTGSALSAAGASHAAGPALQGMRVLLVEDHAVNRQVACELLALQGVQVETAEHGAAALECLKRRGGQYFHAVLMDVQMPVMDGYEATRRLRADPAFARLPVIAMTAHALSEEQALCHAAGMSGHLGKPVEPAALYAALACHFDAAAPPPAQVAPALPCGLAPVAGLDMLAGLRRAGGQGALYRRLLADFAAEYGTAPATLASLLAAAEWPAAERMAHTLRGVAATLGAEPLAALAAQLEHACREGQAAAAAASLARLAPPLRQLVHALESGVAAPADQIPAAPAACPSDWPVRLRHALRACDSAASAVWESCQAEATAVLGRAAVHRVTQALAQFDFDRALAVLADALQPETLS
jgi:two-component system sensor histidine kinase/response regulator